MTLGRFFLLSTTTVIPTCYIHCWPSLVLWNSRVLSHTKQYTRCIIWCSWWRIHNIILVRYFQEGKEIWGLIFFNCRLQRVYFKNIWLLKSTYKYSAINQVNYNLPKIASFDILISLQLSSVVNLFIAVYQNSKNNHKTWESPFYEVLPNCLNC